MKIYSCRKAILKLIIKRRQNETDISEATHVHVYKNRFSETRTEKACNATNAALTFFQVHAADAAFYLKSSTRF